MIRVECQGADRLPLDAIEEFQGNLKKRSKADIEKIILSIEKYGFSFPFFVWQGDGHNRCLDGHGRIQALGEMRRKGENLPLFPVVYVEAKDDGEARQKLLRLNSQYGIISMAGLEAFAEGLDLRFEELSLPDGGTISNIGEATDPTKEWEDLTDYITEDKRAFRDVIVHLADEEAVQEFQDRMEQKLTDKTKYIWIPRQERDQVANIRVRGEE